MGNSFSKMEGLCPRAWGLDAWDASLTESLLTDDELEDPPSSDDEWWRLLYLWRGAVRLAYG